MSDSSDFISTLRSGFSIEVYFIFLSRIFSITLLAHAGAQILKLLDVNNWWLLHQNAQFRVILIEAVCELLNLN